MVYTRRRPATVHGKSSAVFEAALSKARDERLPLQRPDSNINSLGQFDIAGDLGTMLVQYKPIRDLDKAEQALTYVYNSASGYEPSLCSLIDLYYSKGMYEKSAEVASKLIDMQSRSAEWKNSPAPYPAMAEAKAYRVLMKSAKKNGDIAQAKIWAEKLLVTGYATDNDSKIASKL